MPTSFVNFLEAQKGLIGNNIRKNFQIDANIFDDLPLYSGLKPCIMSFEIAMKMEQLTEWWDGVVRTGVADFFDKEGKVQVALKTLLKEIIQYEQKDVGIKIELDDIDKQKKILLDAFISYILKMLALHYANNEACKLKIIASEENVIPEIRKKQFFIEACENKPVPVLVAVKQEKYPQKSTPKKSTPKKSTPKKSTPNKSSSNKNTPNKSRPRKKVQSQSRQIKEQSPVQQEQAPELQPLQAEQALEQQQRNYLIEACKKYQVHLLKEIEKHYPRSGSTLHYAVTSQENRLPYKISFIESAQRDRADSAIKEAIDKYHLVADMRAELHKSNVSVFDQVNNFAQKLNNADNLALLNKNRDSGVEKFFKAVGFLISMFISKAHTGSFAFWKSHGRVFTERLKEDMSPASPRVA